MNYLKTLDYPDEPNYDYLIGYANPQPFYLTTDSLLRGSLEKFGGSEKEYVHHQDHRSHSKDLLRGKVSLHPTASYEP